jgi:hypothetical protein
MTSLRSGGGLLAPGLDALPGSRLQSSPLFESNTIHMVKSNKSRRTMSAGIHSRLSRFTPM